MDSKQQTPERERLNGQQRETLLIGLLILLGVIAVVTAIAVGVNVSNANRYEAITECVAEGNPPLECREAVQ